MINTNNNQSRKTRPRKPAAVVVEREFAGIKLLADVMAPVILEDLRRQIRKTRTIDKQSDTA